MHLLLQWIRTSMNELLDTNALLILYMNYCLTGSDRFADNGDQVVLDLGKGVIAVYHKHVSLARLAGNGSQFCHVYICHANDQHAVA